MHFRLLDSGWSSEIAKAMAGRPSGVRIVCPFIRLATVKRLISRSTKRLEVITRFDLKGFNAGVSEVAALKALLHAGARIRGIVGLHSKMYLFGDQSTIVTSANLTEAAMFKNQEFGFMSTDSQIVSECHAYFDALWSKTTTDLTSAALREWQSILDRVRPMQSSGINALPDFGEIVSSHSPFVAAMGADPPLQSFIKFFGRSNNRSDLTTPIADEVQRSGSNWACTYPTGKRPRQVKDGAVIFMARMVKDPNDYRIYGRAVGREHQPGVDDATPADIAKRGWKKGWSHYVRVHDPLMIDGYLSDGVSMAEMMDELGTTAFAPTLRNFSDGRGNTDPRRAIMRKPSIELTPIAYDWISSRLDAAFLRHGTLDMSGPDYDAGN